MKVELVGFTTPNFVIMKHRDSFPRGESPKFALRDIDAETLAELCDNFRREIFNKAGKVDPIKERVKP